MFQFPSNGKADPKPDNLFLSGSGCLSFNSLQTGKRIQRVATCAWCGEGGYVSIPFKRESGSKVGHSPSREEQVNFCFNSLQTGKRIQRQMKIARTLALTLTFQFPSNGKADPKRLPAKHPKWQIFVSIPFKRESGSKVANTLLNAMAEAESFNSLQTGKRIQRKLN